MLNDPSAPIPFNSNTNIRFMAQEEIRRNNINQSSALTDPKAQSNSNL